MTEEEWLACEDPERMLNNVSGPRRARKIRLFACACCWRIRHLFRNEQSVDALNAAEQFADGLIDDEELRLRRIEYHYAENLAHPPTIAIAATSNERPLDATAVAGYVVVSVVDTQAPWGMWESVQAEQQKNHAELFRDIFGNPFRPVAFDPEWRTSTVVALARGMYESRDFSAMPILADALQDAGCDSAAVLDHCRGPGPHVRGCWVVDLLLGKV